MKEEIKNIVIKTRVRRNLGDLSKLMDSMSRYGLLNPILISESGELIAGHRRLESARKLGWTHIEVRVLEDYDKAEKLEVELHENMQRLDFTAEEEEQGLRQLAKLRKPSLFKRILTAVMTFFKRLFGIR